MGRQITEEMWKNYHCDGSSNKLIKYVHRYLKCITMIRSICAEKQHKKGHNYVYIFAKSTEIFAGKYGSAEDILKMPLSIFV
jgi:hypothetical protein